MGWLILIPGAAALIYFSWPVGRWHLWSFLWIGITILVLIDEVVGKFFSPERKTISNQMRDYRKEHPVKFWIIAVSLLLFCGSLILHVAT